eukprot:scaffold47535_cov46-Prasinocladus_malaysianus.AAC.2
MVEHLSQAILLSICFITAPDPVQLPSLKINPQDYQDYQIESGLARDSPGPYISRRNKLDH